MTDLADPDLYADGDPHAVWRRLRAEQPLFWNEQEGRPGFWAVTKYDDAMRIYKDPATFSSARGILLGTAQGRGDPAGGKMLALTDPPRHGQLRALVNRWFTPGAVSQLEEAMRRIARRLVDAAVARGDCDFVRDVAGPLPVHVICWLLGVPRADRDMLYELTSRAFGVEDRAGQSAAHQNILLYFMELAEQRRLAPADDLVSVLVEATVEGKPLTDTEVLLTCDNLLVGGIENVRHAAAGGILALLDHPGELRRLRADPSLVPSAIEEILRWTSPATHIVRTVRREVQLRGRTIDPGSLVTIWNPSANRDEDVFPDADRFDVGRTPNRHLAMGVGEHFCIGAGVARQELRVLVEELLAGTAAIELAGAPVRLRSCEINGFERLPVKLVA
ncbi:cytochrome P450 [Micromonospora sp. NPDC049044]|uniref:cytochrome P450 n=1 Tax=unclassified Micromonospora TaxID=2617518 RepID=UPI0033DA2F93